MDRRSWPWKRKSPEKSAGESDSTGSVSSHSERCSDDQDALRASLSDTSPNHAQSPEVSLNHVQSPDTSSNHAQSPEFDETVKALSEKLSAALSNISAKEDLVEQHAKVAEEAVAGWEKAETEAAILKQQLEAAAIKNSALEDRIGHLDGALKECVRQLRQSREEQEEKVHEALVKKTHVWEAERLELENRVAELETQFEARKDVTATSTVHDLQARVEAFEKENSVLKVQLLARSEDLQRRTLERDLSTRAAETASKQHLESIKKVAKLQAECRRLKAASRKTCPANDQKYIASSMSVESLTDSQSDSGERLLGLENDTSCSDSWASALIAELDQFKNDKANVKVVASSIELDLMDDFLEMERLAALPEADHGSSSFEIEADSERAAPKDDNSKCELKALHHQIAEMEEKVEFMSKTKTELEMALDDYQNQLNISSNQLLVVENKLVEFQHELDLANKTKQDFEMQLETAEEKRKDLMSQLETSLVEVNELCEKVALLERNLQEEKASSAALAARWEDLEAVEVEKKELECQLNSSDMEVIKLREMLVLLEKEVEEKNTLSIEFASKSCHLEAVEAKTVSLESQLMSAKVEIEELQKKLHILQGELEVERAKSAKSLASLEIEASKRKENGCQLESASLEVAKLQDRVDSLERKVEEEMAFSAEYAVKCRTLEDELASRKQEDDTRKSTLSNGELKLKKEKEFAAAAGKLAECQKTIASLGQQLKSLATVEDFMLEAEMLKPNGFSPNLVAGTPTPSRRNNPLFAEH